MNRRVSIVVVSPLENKGIEETPLLGAREAGEEAGNPASPPAASAPAR